MIIDNIISGVLSYSAVLKAGNLLIALTGKKFAIQKGSFDEFLTVMSTQLYILKGLFPLTRIARLP